MNPPDTNRLHALRMDNDAARYRQEEMRPRFDALRNREAPRAVSAWQLFQTPATVAARMVELADIQPADHVLEPSAGLGRLLRPIQAMNPASVTACEINADLAGELFRQFPTLSIWQSDFLTRTASPQFDKVIMNPPFHMRADIKHTLHALQFLCTGGTLVGLAMATHHRETALQPLADYWEKLPAQTFASEGTRVETYLFRITKP